MEEFKSIKSSIQEYNKEFAEYKKGLTDMDRERIAENFVRQITSFKDFLTLRNRYEFDGLKVYVPQFDSATRHIAIQRSNIKLYGFSENKEKELYDLADKSYQEIDGLVESYDMPETGKQYFRNVIKELKEA